MLSGFDFQRVFIYQENVGTHTFLDRSFYLKIMCIFDNYDEYFRKCWTNLGM
jgi:hypothetical protein